MTMDNTDTKYNTDTKWQKGVDDQEREFIIKDTATECNKTLEHTLM